MDLAAHLLALAVVEAVVAGDVVDRPAIAGAVVRHEPSAALQFSLWINKNVTRTSVNIFN